MIAGMIKHGDLLGAGVAAMLDDAPHELGVGVARPLRAHIPADVRLDHNLAVPGNKFFHPAKRFNGLVEHDIRLGAFYRHEIVSLGSGWGGGHQFGVVSENQCG